MSQSRFEDWHFDLQDLLGLAVPPVAIAFISHVPDGIGRIDRPMPPTTADGRTGVVAAGCVFWIEGTQRVFATEAEDHGNCSVGSLTHGFKTMEEIAHNTDVAAPFETGWVTPEAVAKIAVVREKPTSRVSALIERLRAARAADDAVAAYAAEDSKRFSRHLETVAPSLSAR